VSLKFDRFFNVVFLLVTYFSLQNRPRMFSVSNPRKMHSFQIFSKLVERRLKFLTRQKPNREHNIILQKFKNSIFEKENGNLLSNETNDVWQV